MAEAGAPVFTGVNHIGIVTADLDRSVRVWADRYGIGPWTVHTVDAAALSAEVAGEAAEFGIRVGFCSFGPGRIELIEPLDGESPYAHSLAEHGGADHLHHLRLEVEDVEASLDRLAGLGLRQTLAAEFAGAEPGAPASARYLSTEVELGFVAEVAAIPPGFRLPGPDYVYPPSTAEEGQ